MCRVHTRARVRAIYDADIFYMRQRTPAAHMHIVYMRQKSHIYMNIYTHTRAYIQRMSYVVLAWYAERGFFMQIRL